MSMPRLTSAASIDPARIDECSSGFNPTGRPDSRLAVTDKNGRIHPSATPNATGRPTARLRPLVRAVFLLCVVVAQPLAAREPSSLAAVQVSIVTDHPRVAQMSGVKLAARLARREPLLLLDVREADEYAVSHLADAQRVDPDLWTRTFLARYGHAVRGKTVVFYCSVGVRSSEFAERVQDQLLRNGAAAVANLEGGIFAWHNAHRPLTDAHGATDFVHPYDAHWGTLLTRRAQARSQPTH